MNGMNMDEPQQHSSKSGLKERMVRAREQLDDLVEHTAGHFRKITVSVKGRGVGGRSESRLVFVCIMSYAFRCCRCVCGGCFSVASMVLKQGGKVLCTWMGIWSTAQHFSACLDIWLFTRLLLCSRLSKSKGRPVHEYVGLFAMQIDGSMVYGWRK